MNTDLDGYRIVTASAYAGLMAPLARHPSTVCVLTGDTDNDEHEGKPAAQSLEALDGVRRRWRLGDVARLADFVPKILADALPDTRPALLVPPRLTNAWEQAAAAWPDGVELLGRPAADVSAIADDKVFVREQLRRLGVPVPASIVVPEAETAGLYRRAALSLGVPFVLQTPQGAGGHGTWLIQTEHDLAHALRHHPREERFLVSSYAGDITINVAGLVHPDGVEILPASVQTSGIAELGADYGSYCGSDFGAAVQLPAAVHEAAYAGTARVGTWLHELGHRGVFGADIAVAGNAVTFLEVNPRIQGSSWLLSELQQRQGDVGCLVQHVRSLLGESSAPTSNSARPTWPAGGVAGSHLVLRWTGGCGTVRSVPRAGAYPVAAVAGPVTITGLPAVGTRMSTGAIAARLQADDSLAGPDGRHLRSTVRDFLAAFSAGFEVAS